MRHASIENRLLAGLPHRDRQRLLSSGERIELVLGDVLCRAGARIGHVYFPLDSTISLLIPVDADSSLEVALIGTEGMFGSPLVLGVGSSAMQALVQGSGAAMRLSAAAFRRQLAAGTGLRRRLSLYIYVTSTQTAQSAACVSRHLLEARLARWLLMTQDRAHSNEFYLTHEFLAKMLGVRRVGITKVAGMLQKRKIMSYRRGNITILDRVKLEEVSCSCYRAAIDTYEGILR